MDDLLEAIIGAIGDAIFSVVKDETASKPGRVIALTIVAAFFGALCGGFIYIARESTVWTVIACIVTLPLVIWYIWWLVRIFRGKKTK